MRQPAYLYRHADAGDDDDDDACETCRVYRAPVPAPAAVPISAPFFPLIGRSLQIKEMLEQATTPIAV